MLTGTVREFDFVNPHAWIVMDARGDDGTSETCNIQPVSPIVLSIAGFHSESPIPGAQIAPRAHPSDDEDAQFGWLIDMTKSDGTVLSDRGMGVDEG